MLVPECRKIYPHYSSCTGLHLLASICNGLHCHNEYSILELWGKFFTPFVSVCTYFHIYLFVTKNFTTFWLQETPKIFLFFLDTRPLFENFLKKMIFSPLKSQKHLEKFSKKEKNWLLHIQPRAMSAARAWCRPPTRNFGCPPTMNPHIRNNHHHKLLMELQGGAKRYPRGGVPPYTWKIFMV